jgi:hypothetical protein
MDGSANKVLFFWPVFIASHFFLAVAGGMLIGFFPKPWSAGFTTTLVLNPTHQQSPSPLSLLAIS